MPKYTVYAKEFVYEFCTVEANSPEEAIELAKNWEVNTFWDEYDSDDFEITHAELEESFECDNCKREITYRERLAGQGLCAECIRNIN